MPYIVMMKSRTGVRGTDSDDGDTGDTFATIDEAKVELKKLEADQKFMKELWEQACEMHGIEAWLEVQEADE